MKNFKYRAAKPKWKVFKPFEASSFCSFGHLCCISLPPMVVILCLLHVWVIGLASETLWEKHTFKTVPTGHYNFCVVTSELRKWQWPGKPVGFRRHRWRFPFLNLVPRNILIHHDFSYLSLIYKIYYRLAYWLPTEANKQILRFWVL